MARSLFWLGLFFALLAAAAFRDVVFLKSGEEVRCNIERIDKKSVVVETVEGKRSFPREEVVRITLTHPRPGDDWEKTSDITDSLLLYALSLVDSAADYPKASYVVLYRGVHYDFSRNGGCRRTERKIVLIKTSRGKDLNASHRFYYISPWQRGDVDFCRTITPDGLVYHLDDAALEFAEPYQRWPQYNLLHRVKFAPPQISEGAVVDIQFHIDYDTCDALHPITEKLSFRSEEPVLHQVLEVSFPKGWGKGFCRYHAFAEPEVTESGDKLVLRWSKDYAEPFVYEPYTAPRELFVPTVWLGFGVDEALLLAALSDSLSSSLDGSDALDRLVDSLVQKATSPREKLYEIYEYLNLSFRGAPIGPEKSLWFPRRVSEIFADGIANRLDKATLMLYMLKRVGIECKLAYGCDIVDAQAVEDVPSLGFFKNPCVLVELEGEVIACQPYVKYLAPGVLQSNIAGQPAIVVGARSSQITALPQNPPDANSITDTLWVELAPNGDATVHLKRVYGKLKSTSVRSMRELREDERTKRFQQDAGRIYDSAQLVKYSLRGLESFDSTVVLEAEYSVPKLAQEAGRKLMALRLPMLKYSAWSAGVPVRETPMWFSSPSIQSRTWIISPPGGFAPRFLPGDVTEAAGDSIRFEMRFTHDDERGTIKATLLDARTDKLIPPNEYPRYREYVFTRVDAAKRWIVLER